MLGRRTSNRDRTPAGVAARIPVVAAASLLLVVTVNACDTGDGRVMQDPEFPLPPTTTAPPSSVPPDLVSGPIATASPTAPISLRLVMPWPDGAEIPARYTCDDANLAPALSWGNLPPETVELAVTLTDLDAGFTHWIMFGIQPPRTGLAEGEVPTGAIVWPNEFGTTAYDGPCPPAGEPAHTYLFTVHALNQQLEVADDATSDEVISMLNLTAVVQSSVSGTYARAG